MYSCFIHNWYSSHTLCPSCPIFTQTSTTAEIDTDQFIAVSKKEYDALKTKLREVPWTEEDWQEEMMRVNHTNLERISFMAGVKWSEKRIKEREL